MVSGRMHDNLRHTYISVDVKVPQSYCYGYASHFDERIILCVFGRHI